MKRLLIPLVALLVGCGGDWPTGEVCNQRDRILFAGEIANSEAKHCEGFDFDHDDVYAPYDADDRLNRFDHDGDGVDGSLVGDIEECRYDDPNTLPQDHVQYYNWSCITDYWFAQLDTLCIAWNSGDMTMFDDENLEIEAEYADVYCVSPEADTAAE